MNPTIDTSDTPLAAQVGALRKSLATALICVTAMVGCLVPERFAAKIDVHSDASYTFEYSGSAVHALAAAKILKNGAVSPKEESMFQKEAEKLAKYAHFKSVEYKGMGRFQLEIEAKKDAGQPLKILDTFTVSTSTDGVMEISTKEITEKGKRELNQLGITINGKFAVRLPKNVVIISHNATSTPSFFGLTNTYSWKIDTIEQRPLINFRFVK